MERFKKYGYRTLKPIIQIGNETLLNKCVSSLPKSNQQIFLMRKKIYNNKKIIKEIENFKNTKNIVIPVYKKTDGQVSTCLLARKFLEPNKIFSHQVFSKRPESGSYYGSNDNNLMSKAMTELGLEPENYSKYAGAKID